MKNVIRTGLISLGFILAISPALAFAQSTGTSSQVATLLAELRQLQTQLAQSQGQSSTGVQAASSCLNLSYNLYVGSTDSTTNGQVTKLQQFLGMNSTGYFGSLTQQAVQKWQSSYGIVSSGTPSTTGFGSVGPKTRAAIGCTGTASANASAVSIGNSSGQMQTYTNAQYGFSLQYPSNFSAVPVPVLNGTKITLTGPQLSGFSQAPSVLIEASDDPNAVSTCNTENLSGLATVALAPLTSLGINITPTSGTQTIGGVSFRSASVSADVEGSFIQVGFYAALNNGTCYIIGTSVEGKDSSTQGQLQSSSPVVLPASAASVAAEENAILQSLSFSTPTASASQTGSSAALSQATVSLQDAVRKSNINAIQVDLELYYSQNGKYPSTLTTMQNVITSTQDFYDPATFQSYNYQTDTAGDSYTLCATLSTGANHCVSSAGSPSTSQNTASSNSQLQTAPTCSMNASPNVISPGESSTITWSSQNATEAIFKDLGQTSSQVNGNTTVSSPTAGTQAFTIIFSGPGGQTTCSASFTVASIANSSPSTSTSVPYPISLSPSQGTIGTQVIITGTGFATTGGNTILFDGVSLGSANASNGTLNLTVPSIIYPSCSNSSCAGTVIAPGSHYVTVQNANGQSGLRLLFTVLSSGGASATLNPPNFTALSNQPVIIQGSASGATQVIVDLSMPQSGTVWNSGTIAVTNGQWSVTTSPLQSGSYTITVVQAGGNGTALATGTLTAQ